jgi:hypothetical protein
MNFKNFSIIASLTAIALTAFNAPANATAYRSPGGTYLELKEGGINVNDVPGAIGSGRYKSGPWNGTFTSTNITALPPTQGQGGRKKYQGNYQATHTTTGQVCTGQISITRYAQGQGVGMVGADVTWLNSSLGCSLINGGSPLNIEEPLPYTTAPNFDFTAPVANVLKSNTATWWRWRAIDPVNCRAGAGTNNNILYSFTVGQSINARSPMSTGTGNGIVLDSSGKPWMKVQNPGNLTTQCYIRANTNFILPIRLGF